ncbi:hypothetical protein N9W34_03855 [Rickettsiales bacterium]|nr:hypothetical protein [Rickettsiales bacterium]
MNEYVFSADLLNKYSQLTPWVQAFVSISFSGVIIGVSYFFKQSVTEIMKPFIKAQTEPKEQKPEWKDNYYRGEESH